MPIRLRLAGIVALTALVLVVGAGLLLSHDVRSGITATVHDSLRHRVARVERDLSSGSLQLVGRTGTLHEARDQTIVQVLSLLGQVEYSTEVAGSAPLLDSGQLRHADRAPTFFEVSRPEWHYPCLLLAKAVSRHRDEVVLAGASLDELNGSIASLWDDFLLLGPLVVVIAALGGWFVAGRALRPVELMRREAELLFTNDANHALELPTTRDELRRLAETLNGLLARLHGALEVQTRFIAAASHELRTPLAAIVAELEVARMRGVSDVERATAFELLRARLDQLVRLTGDLLCLAVGDERHESIDISAQRIEPLAAEALRQFVRRADALGISLVLDFAPEVVGLVEPESFRRVLDNLIVNAFSYAKGTDVVQVHGHSEEDEVIVEVCDHGPGFPEWFLPHAFDRFSRAQPTRGPDTGAGLGLAIVKSLIQAQGGSVEVANAPDGGAVVRVRLISALANPAAVGLWSI